MKFCITTLTHNLPGRNLMLEKTIDSFLTHTELPFDNISWYIYCNGYDDDTVTTINRLMVKYSNIINLIIIYSNTNDGVGCGINKLNQITKNYEYVLFIEGDWVCLHSDDSGQPKNWLKQCIDILDVNSSIDSFFLRRYTTIYDSRQTGIEYHFKSLIEHLNGEVKYFTISFPTYTNNPILRRNSAYYNKKIYPLQEFVDINGKGIEIKGNVEWGRAELSAGDDLRRRNESITMAFLYWGIFVHIENSYGIIDNETYRITNDNNEFCGNYTYGASKCKFGYLKNIQPHMCALCKKTTNPFEVSKIFQKEGEFLTEMDKKLEMSLLEKYNDYPEKNLDWVFSKLSPNK